MSQSPSDPPSPEDDDGSIGAGLSWSEDGSPRSTRFGDVYFSRDDGLAESRAVFLGGCDLPGAWAGREHFTVAELGFGTGLNIVALLDLWRRKRASDEGARARLNVFSIEAYPLSAEEAARALAAWPEMAEIAALVVSRWPPATPGFHRIDLPELCAVIDLAVGEVDWALDQWRGAADAWFLDGFSPALNPQMWSPQVFGLIAARSAPDARLATFTVAGAVRRGLADQGFQVDKRPGHGRKRERLEARLTGMPVSTPRPRIAVVGGGIAGASVIRALSSLGAEVSLVEAGKPGAGASGFPAALVTPRLDAGDAVIAAFHAQALARAGDLYEATPQAVIARGVLQLEQAERDGARFARVAAQPWWPQGQMIALDAAAAGERLSDGEAGGALSMAGALTVRPAAVVPAWTRGAVRVRGRVARIERSGPGWSLLDEAGQTLFEGDAVVLAAGWGTSDLVSDTGLEGRFRPVRGQADWVEGADVSVQATAWGGYVAPTGDGVLFGATHDRDDIGTEVRATDSERNLAVLAARLPGFATRLAARSVGTEGGARAAIRATTPDRLPVCGRLEDGLYVLGGLGSRGFCVAPLLGEHLAALILGLGSPLPGRFADRLAPDRFGPQPPRLPSSEQG